MNAQSVRNKVLSLEAYLSHVLKDIAVLCVAEHFLTKDEVPGFVLGSYTPVSCFCRSKNRGGSLVMVRRDIHAAEVAGLVNLSAAGVCEVSAVELAALKLIVISIYRPPVVISGSFSQF